VIAQRWALIAGCVALASCGGRDASQAQDRPRDLGTRTAAWIPDPAATILHAAYSGVQDSARGAISEPAPWQDMWNLLTSGNQPRPPLPAVDFSTDDVLFVSLGRRSSGGHDIRIDSVVRYQARTVVYLTRTSPGPTCMTTQALTAPVHVVRLPRLVRPLEFHELFSQHAC